MTRNYYLLLICLLGLCFPQALLAKPKAEELWRLPSQASSGAEVKLGLPSFAPVIEKLGQSVVSISVSGKRKVKLPSRRRSGAPERPFYGGGSGFVIHEDGYIVTNNHVVESASKIEVFFKDEDKGHSARILGRDQKSDIALIKIDVPKKLVPVTLGNSDELRTGDWVIAMGNPLAIGHSATLGIVSAKSRKTRSLGPYTDFIQFDASINQGSSGGPLFNSQGQVVGVNTAIYGPSIGPRMGINVGISLAAPINFVRGIVSQLHSSGQVTRGWLGVLIQDFDEDMASLLGLNVDEGALVAEVVPGSPADKAGILQKDVIVAFDLAKVKSSDDLPPLVASTPVGKEVNVKLVRKGKEEVLKVKIDLLQDQGSQLPVTDEEIDVSGVKVDKLPKKIAEELGLDGNRGVIVAEIKPGSPGAISGLFPGDVVIEVGDKAIKKPKDFYSAVSKLEKDKPVLLLVKRGKATLFITLKVAGE